MLFETSFARPCLGALVVAAAGIFSSLPPASGQEKLVPESSTWKYFKGTEEPPEEWKELAFDDSAWAEGATPIGYGPDLAFKTTLSDMANKYLSVYIRRKFAVADPSAFASLTLSLKYDDGFVAYLNGSEIFRKGFTEGVPVLYDTAASDHEANATFENFPLDCEKTGLLRAGENVLAIQGHNVNLTSSDFALEVELKGLSQVCPTDLQAKLLSDKKRVQVTWKRPAGVMAYHELKLTRNGEELPLASGSLTSYIDREPLLGVNEYELRATLCAVQCSLDVVFVFEGEGPRFRRGDANQDLTVNISDAVFVLNHLFLGGDEPKCLDSADSNDDGRVNLTDPVYLLQHLFQSGPALPAPGLDCGVEPEASQDSLPACVYTGC
ncbi:MAG: dockerin type I repeat-containing protein [Planctomycetota bacterium]